MSAWPARRTPGKFFERRKVKVDEGRSRLMRSGGGIEFGEVRSRTRAGRWLEIAKKEMEKVQFGKNAFGELRTTVDAVRTYKTVDISSMLM